MKMVSIKIFVVVNIIWCCINCSLNGGDGKSYLGDTIDKKEFSNFALSYFRACKTKNFSNYVQLIYPGCFTYFKRNKINVLPLLREVFSARCKFFSGVAFSQIEKTMYMKTIIDMVSEDEYIPSEQEIKQLKINIGCSDVYWVEVGFEEASFNFCLVKKDKSGKLYLIADPVSFMAPTAIRKMKREAIAKQQNLSKSADKKSSQISKNKKIDVSEEELKKFALSYFRTHIKRNFSDYTKLVYPGCFTCFKFNVLPFIRTMFMVRCQRCDKDVSLTQIKKSLFVKLARDNKLSKEKIENIKKRIGCSDIYRINAGFKDKKGKTKDFCFYITKDSKSGKIFDIDGPLEILSQPL